MKLYVWHGVLWDYTAGVMFALAHNKKEARELITEHMKEQGMVEGGQMKPVQKLRRKNYDSVIQVNVPTRFYWTKDGFDGVEFGPFDSGVTKYQRSLLAKILNVFIAFIPTK